MDKSIFASKTFWGIVVMAVSFALKQFGVEIGTAEQTELVLNLTEFSGLIVALWGRITARKDIKLLGKSTTAMLLAIVILAMPGCALKDKPAHEQAMATADACLTSYEALYNEYVYLHAALPEQQPLMERSIAPVMDDAKLAIVSLSDATAAWVRLKTKPLNWDALYTRATKLIADATKLIARVKGGN